MATHSRILAWKNPWIEEPGGIRSKGPQKSQTQLNNWAHTHFTTETFRSRCDTRWPLNSVLHKVTSALCPLAFAVAGTLGLKTQFRDITVTSWAGLKHQWGPCRHVSLVVLSFPGSGKCHRIQMSSVLTKGLAAQTLMSSCFLTTLGTWFSFLKSGFPQPLTLLPFGFPPTLPMKLKLSRELYGIHILGKCSILNIEGLVL